MFKKAKQYDFLRLIKWIGFLLAFVIIMNFGVCLFAISSISSETSKYADSVVLSYVREVQLLLDNIDSNMAAEIISDSRLDDIESGLQDVKKLQTLKTIKDLLGLWNKQYNYPVNHVIYFPVSENVVIGNSTDESYKEWTTIKDDLINVLLHNNTQTEKLNVSVWNVINLKGKNYIIKYYHYKERYICCWIDIDFLINKMVAVELGNECLFIVSSEEGKAYNNQERLKEEGISIPVSLKNKSLVKEFMSSNIVINEPVKGTSFCLNAVILGYSPVAGLLKMQIVLVLIMGGIVLICITFILYIKRTVIQPIHDFSVNIKKLREDNNYTVETHYQISELKNASEILANLVNQINGLKIDIYERTLEQQKIKMDFLSLQIEPHFFLNCLNVIYHMTEIKKYKEVQNLSQIVSDYLRYVFKIKDDVTPFGDELEHTKKYLEIQKIRYRDGFEVSIDVEDEVLPLKVPTLLLQTFVENAIKHTIDWEDKITISIRAKRTYFNDGNYLSIEVEDSGEGFDKEILQKLRNGADISEGEKRIGIMNAIQRMHLKYGERGKIYFNNRLENGAVVRIYIPIEEE